MVLPSHLSAAERQALTEYVSRLRSELEREIVEIRLFGSKARGDFSPESDIDVLVIIAEASAELKNRIVDLAFDVNLEYNVFISPVIYSREVREHPLWRVTHFGRATEQEGIPL